MSTLTSPAPTEVVSAQAPSKRNRKHRLWWVTATSGVIALVVNIPWLNAILVSFKSEGDIGRGALVSDFSQK